MITMIIECVGLEFSLDRSDANKVILHLVMAGAVAIPVIQGFVLLRRKKADDEDGVPEGTGSMKAVFLVSVVIFLERSFSSSFNYTRCVCDADSQPDDDHL